MLKDIEKKSSVTGLKNVLERIIKSETDSNHMGIIASDLASQGSMCKLDIPAIGVKPISLNTLKAHSEKYLSGGWVHLNELRVTAFKKLSPSKAKKKIKRGSKEFIEYKLGTTQNSNQQLINEIARFAEQYRHLNEICRIQASVDENFDRLYKQHLRRYAEDRGRLQVVKKND